ncbi:carbohydrate ABC transporter permease [Metabacillus sp. HB246100]
MSKSHRMTFLFLLPAIVIFLLFTVYPLLYALFTSFFDLNYLKGDRFFLGLENYKNVLSDQVFWVAVRNTVLFVLVAVTLEVIVGVIVALLFNVQFKGVSIIRSIVLLPMLLPPITVALTWKMMYEYDYGVINYILTSFGLPAIEWLSSPSWAMISIIITDVWQWTPFVFLIILASLQGIPKELYESAQVNGANAWQCTRFVTLPLIKPAIFLVLLLRTIETFQVFEKMYVLTGGGPGNATETITFYIYRYGFKYFETGYATAATIIMVGIIVILSLGYIYRVMQSVQFSK